MMQQVKAKIFLAEERGCNETRRYRSHKTFNHKNFYSEHKTAFGTLNIFNDETLAPGQSVSVSAENRYYVVILPVVGAVVCKYPEAKENVINAGQAQVLYLEKGSSFELSNPYEEGLINFLQVWIGADVFKHDNKEYICEFDINENRNRLMYPFAGVAPDINKINFAIGKFAGREEANYSVADTDNGIFVFIIQGAFEVEGRLLHQRDGLALWGIDTIELEALSTDAIILLLEIPLRGEK